MRTIIESIQHTEEKFGCTFEIYQDSNGFHADATIDGYFYPQWTKGERFLTVALRVNDLLMQRRP
jgi:hypothetical protein